MKFIRACFILLGLAAVTATAQDLPADAPEAVEAADAPPEADSGESEAIIPAPYAVSRYESAWSKNPFLRKTVVTAAPKETFAKDWALNGMAEYSGKIRVVLVNKQTGEYKRVTNQDGPEAEFKLVKANFSRDRSEVSVEIEKAGEIATLKYDENLSSKPITVVNTQRAASGAQAGQPGQPGQPVQAAPPSANRPVSGKPMPGQPGAQGGVGAVMTSPGGAPVPMGVKPMVNTPSAQPGTPPSISRRRQLVPAPVIPPQQ